MKTRAFAFTSVLLITSGCSRPAAETPRPSPTQPGTGFFVGVDPARLPAQDRAVLLAVEKDIDLVLHGKPPHAKIRRTAANRTAAHCITGARITP